LTYLGQVQKSRSQVRVCGHRTKQLWSAQPSHRTVNVYTTIGLWWMILNYYKNCLN